MKWKNKLKKFKKEKNQLIIESEVESNLDISVKSHPKSFFNKLTKLFLIKAKTYSK